MAEKQKESSSNAKSKEKTALLADLDLGKDFLTSWKSMAEDDQMDFDFPTVAKGNKKPFKFDNMDIDFKLDDDFGKMSSFNVDISDLDVSSPVKKAGKPSGKSKEVSAEKKTRGKSDRSNFQFDFDAFDDFNFEPSLGKIAKKINANQDAECSPSLSGSLGFGTHLKETIGASEGDTTSKFDSQPDGESNSLSKEKSHTSFTDVHLPSKSEITKDQATNLGATTSPQRPICGNTQETDQDNCQKEGNTQQEPYKETCQNSLQSASENSSTHQIACTSTEEVDCLARKESTNTDGGQSISGEKTDFGSNCGNLHLDKVPVDIACSQSNDGENTQFSGDNPVRIDNNDDAEPGQSGTQFEQTSTTTASMKMLHEIETDGGAVDVTSELVVTPSKTMETIIETTGDKEIPGLKQVTNVIRSKYFKGSDEAKLQQSSVSQIKAAAFGSQRTKTSQLSPADEEESLNSKDTRTILSNRSRLQDLDVAKGEPIPNGSEIEDLNKSRKLDSKIAETGRKSAVLPKAISREQIEEGSVHIRTQGIPKDLTINGGGYISGNGGRTLNGTSRIHGKDAAKEKPVLSGSGKNLKNLNTFGLHVRPSSSNEQTKAPALMLGLNPKLPLLGMKALQNNIISSENQKGHDLKEGARISVLPKLKNMRTTETVRSPSNSMLQKDTRLLTNSRQHVDLKENTGSGMAHLADTNEKASSSPLKRKKTEDSSANMRMLKPTKRLLKSPSGSRDFRDSWENLADKENICDGNTENSLNESLSSCLHIPQKVDMKELETSLEIDNDINVERAQACAKELDDLANMLKKKHEEAKEILVRAVVNNNKLLMLNHPMAIHEEKIRLIEEFAALLLSK
ncbi:hypothetical protein POM88_034851 [Heracleum sosnowskyi]|uniref:Uncharacterized protein n=1 Tax=Heracleum sosnowskyi TaxID=360622 RepID=A0AAD8HLY2_9APIA|nr:hypothetical protein POM88_034851 [Heracleum sosnowskyi]